jgi:hypothetical protein
MPLEAPQQAPIPIPISTPSPAPDNMERVLTFLRQEKEAHRVALREDAKAK